MSKPARGTKRVCPSCGERFYDLNRTPIVCPVCQSKQEADAPVLEGPEIVSLEEAEEGTSEVPIEDDEEIVGIGDDGAEIPAADDENAFLEEEEEGKAHVSGIVGGGKNEERS